MSQYRKGYRREKQARQYFEEKHNCVCMESRGSHGIADLICGNGIVVYVIQVKDSKHAKYVDINALKNLARLFKGVPVLMVYYPYKEWHLTYL